MTPWLTLAIPTQPSKPERVAGLRRVRDALTRLASCPGDLRWLLLEDEGPEWTVGHKWCQAIDACRTEWLWLLADDVYVMTPRWDLVLATVAEGPFDLMHGQDGLFGRRLATYPCVRADFARTLLPSLRQYAWYRIDDHLHDVARRVDRVAYLPELLCVSREAVEVERYAPDLVRFAADNAVYHDLEPQRVADAARLKGLLTVTE